MVKYIALKPLIVNEKKIAPGKQVKGMTMRLLEANIRLGRIKKIITDDDEKEPVKEPEKEPEKGVNIDELELHPESEQQR